VIKWERNKKTLGKGGIGAIEIDLDTLYSDFPKGDFEKEEDKLLVLKKKRENCSS
jgi:hypothetical protein